MDADSDASDWGETDSMGVRVSVGDGRTWALTNSITSLWDCNVINIDSVDVIHPLLMLCQRSTRERYACYRAHLQARQSFKLISAFSRAFLSAASAIPFGLDGPASVE